MKRPGAERCWWCGETADSREHRVKKSRIKKIMQTTDLQNGENLSWHHVGELSPIRGPGAAVVQFGMTMCRKCNNNRSQDFDKAYDTFLEFIMSDLEQFRRTPIIVWAQVYEGKKFDQRHLARYFAKNIACRIVEHGVDVPQDLIRFLDDITLPAPFTLTLFSDYPLLDAFAKAGLTPDPNYANSGTLRLLDREGDTPADPEDYDGFIAVMMDGPLGVYFEWKRDREYSRSNTLSLSDEVVSAIVDRRRIPNTPVHHDLEVWRVGLIDAARKWRRAHRIEKLRGLLRR